MIKSPKIKKKQKPNKQSEFQTGFRKTLTPLDVLAKELYGKWDFVIGNNKPQKNES